MNSPTSCSARPGISFQHAIPFFQRGILTTLRQWPSTRRFDFDDFMRLLIDAKLQASTTIAVVSSVGYDPLTPFELRPWPITRYLITALHADSPFSLAIVEPYVCRRWISKPTATRFEIS